MYKRLAVVFLLFAVSTAPARAVTIDWTPIGNPGNAGELSGVSVANGAGPDVIAGAVPYSYQIGTYEVTNAQYAEFLNAKDPTGANTLGLYYSGMGSDPLNGGIGFNAALANGQKYAVINGHANQPVTYVTWYSSIRFANWLNNNQGNGSTETGAYTLGPLGPGGVPILGNSIVRNANATVFLPSENEWFKAAYYNPATNSYMRFPTGTSTLPNPQAPPGDANSANYVPGGWPNPDVAHAVGHLTDVGAYAGTTSPYGTYDQGGNALEWTEALISSDVGLARGLRGGSFSLVWDHMIAGYRDSAVPKFGWYSDVGFRVATSAGIPNIPEPSTLALSALGCIGLVLFRRRVRRRPLRRAAAESTLAERACWCRSISGPSSRTRSPFRAGRGPVRRTSDGPGARDIHRVPFRRES
jgi:formylglycine-generating enzyme